MNRVAYLFGGPMDGTITPAPPDGAPIKRTAHLPEDIGQRMARQGHIAVCYGYDGPDQEAVKALEARVF